MTGRYQEYFEYQPTNDVHVKQLPIGWVMKPLGLISARGRTSFVDGPFGSDLKSNEYQDEGIPLIQLNNITIGKHILQNMKYITEEKMNQLSRHIAKPSDIVIAKMADPVARATVVNDKFEKYVIVADCVKLTIDTSIVDLSYVIHAINSKEVNSSAEQVSTGTTRIRINLTELKNLKIPFPPLATQQKIANFLDHETAKIDSLIAKQEKLIALLKEKRQAVISHAVTRGLNPDAPMKDSGVEWLGEVPEHWEIKRLKYLCDIQTGTRNTENAIENGKYPFFVRSQTVERINSKTFDCEAVLTAGDGVGVGKVYHYINGEFDFHQRVYMLNKFKLASGKFIFNYLEQNFYKVAMAGQAKSTVDSLRLPLFLNFEVTVPPKKEQEDIIKYVEHIKETFDTLMKKTNKSIVLIKERKTSLISAAVTGKIDVRSWQKQVRMEGQ